RQNQRVEVTREQLQHIQEQNGETQVIRNRVETPGPAVEEVEKERPTQQKRIRQNQRVEVTREQLQHI
ncbi:hypothetical protein, partial [Bacillus cereus]|uniref:hypothetical protein n=1 Tax=Bacillus cereus TaxID=1396 RepID=UPI0018F7516D